MAQRNTLLDVLYRTRRLGGIPVALIVISSVALVSFIDFITGPDLPFALFYIGPITLAIFLPKRNFGYIISLVCAALMVAIALLGGEDYGSFWVFSWNLATIVGYNFLYTYIVSRLLEIIKELRALSVRDPLTQAANWRYFEEYFNSVLHRAKREKTELTCLFFDIDDFKSANDRLGHAAGDEILKTVSKVILAGIRPDDILARLGGDEFAVILLNMNFAVSEKAAGRLFADAKAVLQGKGLSVTFSVGAVTYRNLPSTVDEIIKKADALMYDVKKSGKDSMLHIEV